MMIDTPGVIGVDCELETPGAKYHVLAPATVQIDRSLDSLQVKCKKAQYFTTNLSIPSKMYIRHTVLNAANGIIPGVAYDVGNHALYEYPHVITVQMELDPDAVEAGTDRTEGMPEPLQKKPVNTPVQLKPETAPAAKTMSHALRK